jgi:2-oxoglutarate ferredoxin oxidoreductase subunit beta
MKKEAPAKKVICTIPRLHDGWMLSLAPWCPGCHIGIINRLLCEVMEELGIQDRAIGVMGLGCSAAITPSIDTDRVWTPHGRELAVASVVKRFVPQSVVYATVGDGALLAIGAAHFLNTAARGEKITAIFVNNGGYGRTGGQVAPTTLAGMKSTTTPYGRDPQVTGFPLHGAEIASAIKGVAYSVRVTVHTAANYRQTKRAIRTAFHSACPTNWQLSPVDSLEFIDKWMIPEFPLGEFKNVDSIDYSFDPELTKLGMVIRERPAG